MSLARNAHRSSSTPQAALGAAFLIAVSFTTAGSTHAAPPAAHAAYARSLPLGPAGLPETRTTTTLQPGVTSTHIVRGAFDPSTPWVVELSIPSSSTSPDPDAPPRAVQDQSSADDLVRRLAAAGFTARSEAVRQPAVADVPAGVIGYRVRATPTFSSQADATAYATRLKAAGFSGRSWYAGWDGASMAKGQWSINVLTIDPRRFRGRLGATFGPDLVNRETTTALGEYAHAKAAVNGGFFVLDPKAGAPGDPAGAGVYGGVLESETVAGRPALVLDAHALHTRIARPVWKARLSTRSSTLALDGINRVPGLIRNCGGDAGDQPTDHPMHDTTCTDPDELVAFTTAYGASTPAGPGAEVVLDRTSRVVRVDAQRGTTLQPGQRSVQATGDLTPTLSALRPGQVARLDLRLTEAGGGSLVRPGTTVVNGGPQLLRNGAEYITQNTDGMVHPTDPSFAYGWVLQRNPRTFAGEDAAGRTLLVTVDGRQPDQLGLSIPEEARVAQALGMREAVNLDGGGSTAMSIAGRLVTHPSDASGERPVGDAIVIR
ncbi:phosphodiester glycosidase family protein [Terrabacter sp. BE26]|uniref:phosphodiester glycosidase family protein n=1 Tax=Terrabacter sp. BE26 TaxID=2898152 RepID=UPI0035BE5213